MRNVTEYPPPVPGRERAAARWQWALLFAAVLLMVSGLVAAVSAVMALPETLVWIALIIVFVSSAASFVALVGLNWTRAMPFHQGLGLAARWAMRAICSLVA
jgi:hypothetical protein